jgi:hypothetical protein
MCSMGKVVRKAGSAGVLASLKLGAVQNANDLKTMAPVS